MNELYTEISLQNLAKRPSPTAILNPRCDPIFKGIFTRGTKESNLALRRLVSAMIGREVKTVTLQPNEPPVETLSNMQMSFDMGVVFDDGETADIEMQGRNSNNEFDARAEIQAARLLTVSARKGNGWKSPKVYQISVLNFEFDKNDNSPLSWYTMRKDTGGRLRERLNVIFLDLVKIRRLRNTPIEQLSDAEKWGMFFAFADDPKHREYIKQVSETEEGIMAADFVVKTMSEEDANWFRQNSYFIAQRDNEDRILRVLSDTAKNLLRMNLLTPEQIAQAVSLPLEEILSLSEELRQFPQA